MDIKQLKLFSSLLIAASVLSSCASTTGSSEGSSETFKNTTKVTTDFTSSTSPSNDDEAQAALVLQFATVNFSRLRADMAVGSGEHLESLAVLLSIDESNKDEFYTLTKTNFQTLFTSADTTPEQLVAHINSLMRQAQL